MNSLIWTIILSMLPISELRGGIIYGILNGMDPIKTMIIALFFNILIIPLWFFFLDYINCYLLKIKVYERFFNSYLDRKVKNIKIKYEHLSLFVLFIFVAIPAPGTGAYTGGLIAWFFKMNRIKAMITIALGVIFAGAITTLVTMSGRGILNFIF